MAITDDQYNTLAQYNHMLAGSTVVLLAVDIFPKDLWYVVGFYVALTSFKEFYYDYRYESAEVRGSSLSDWVHYQIGAALALIVHYGALLFHNF